MGDTESHDACGEYSTNTIKRTETNRNGKKGFNVTSQVSGVTCHASSVKFHMSCVMYCRSPITCH